MIIVTIRESTVALARRRLGAVGPGAGGVEIRLDDLAGQDWAGLIAGARLPVVATCRPSHLGGGFAGSEEERVELLAAAAAAGAAWVDVELGSAAEALRAHLPAERLVISHHEFDPGVGRLDATYERLVGAAPGRRVKLAYMPRRCSDCLAGRQLLARARRDGVSLILITMGEAGIPGRLMACSWGSTWSYASPDGAPPAAPGQMSLARMASLYNVENIEPETVLTGLLGHPIATSLSPWMHNRAAALAGIDARYLPFPEQDAADFVLNMPAWGLTGASVTRPHKRAVLPWMDDLSDAARACQAVNTITHTSARLHGDNTDASAAMAAIGEAWPSGRDLRGLRFGVIGAGGAARSVVWAAREAGGAVTVYARHVEAAADLAREFGVACEALAALDPVDLDVLVNATPVGTWPDIDSSPVPDGAVGGELVFDLVSNPETTCLLRLAAERGIATQNGVAMLVRQGEAQYRLWHGVPPPPGAFLVAAREGLRHPG
ncbi:MAG: type I 3-dehydroquinate dehydratase [Acidobacteriota bacterium]